MEYDPYRKIAWYWTFLFSTFCLAVVVMVFWNNPYLYDQTEYRATLGHRLSLMAQPVPSVEKQLRPATDPGEPLQSDPSSKTWSHLFYNVDAVNLPMKDQPGLEYFLFGNDFYTIGDSKLKRYDSSGQKSWEFDFSKTAKLRHPAFDQAMVYPALSNGQLFALARDTGALVWENDVAQKIHSQPFLHGDKLYLFATLADTPVPKAKERTSRNSRNDREQKEKLHGITLISVKRGHGEIDKIYPPIADLEDKDVEISFSEDMELLFVTQDNKVVCLDFNDMKVLWQVTLPAKAMGPILADAGVAYTATEEGHILSFNAEHGQKILEMDLEAKLLMPPVFIPSHNYLTVVTEGNLLQAVDARTGEKKWHFKLENDDPNLWAYSTRLNNSSITEIKLKWIHKGWSLFIPCMRSRICIFNPENGQVVSRLTLHGQPLMQPALGNDKMLRFLTRGSDGDLKLETVLDKGSYQRWLTSKQHETF